MFPETKIDDFVINWKLLFKEAKHGNVESKTEKKEKLDSTSSGLDKYCLFPVLNLLHICCFRSIDL